MRATSALESTSSRTPLFVFASIELALFLINTLVALLLSSDISENIFFVQNVALSVGIPLRAAYAACAACLLAGPTFPMGATLPVASEVLQRQMRSHEPRTITVLFFINTTGAAIGAFGTTFYRLPYLGQTIALIIAAACNLIAAGAVLVSSRSVPTGLAPPCRTDPGEDDRRPRVEDRVGLGLGFPALGYEMCLYRLMILAHEPLPHTFATTLCLFLVSWSIGVYLAPVLRNSVAMLFVLSALSVAAIPFVYRLDRFRFDFDILGGVLLYFVPVVCFGALYGCFVSRSAREWGRDVGRFFAMNTAGCCAGILFFTLVGYELPQGHDFGLIGAGFVALCLFFLARSSATGMLFTERRLSVSSGALILAMVVVTTVGPLTDSTSADLSGARTPSIRRYRPGAWQTFWGRDGVIEITPDGNVLLDGIWHTRFSDGSDHVGDVYTWQMATCGLLAHRDSTVEDALVIGFGVGLTASTVSRVKGVRVDGYEINRTLEHVP